MRKLLIGVLSVLLVVLIGLGLYVYRIINAMTNVEYANTNEKETSTNVPPSTADKDEFGISDSAPDEKDTGVVNVLLFGLDRRSKNETSRSDAIMIATLDKKHKAIKLTSLMRDTYVEIPGHGKNRLNAAYAFGGPTLAIKTVNKNFNLDISRYVSVDFFALEKIIDTVGGVDINVKRQEIKVLNQYLYELNTLDKKKDSPYVRKAGLQTLDGKQAVAYARIRYVGNGDFERTERQKTVLNEILKKGKSINVLKLPDLAASILPYTETNIPMSEILNMATTVLGMEDKEIHSFRIPVDGTFKNKTVKDGAGVDMAVLVPDMEENTKLLHEFIFGEVK